jgi:uncharacterized protein (TIGR02246 family)
MNARPGRLRSLPALFFIAMACIIALACSARKPDPVSPFGAEAARVRSVLERLVAADNRSDLDGVVACYAENVLLVPPNGAPISGLAAVREHYRALLERDRLELAIEFGETMLGGVNAVVRGRTHGRRIGRGDGSTTAIDDDFEAALRQGTDREWRIERLSWHPRSASQGT